MSSDFIEARSADRLSAEQAPSVGTLRHRWAVMLAGGDGTRLQSLTLNIYGRLKAEAVCSIIGGESLLSQTRRASNRSFKLIENCSL
jgi:hypothetical protein